MHGQAAAQEAVAGLSDQLQPLLAQQLPDVAVAGRQQLPLIELYGLIPACAR